MNILQVLPELNYGGVETGTVDLSKYLVKKGHRAVVVSAGGDLVKDLEDAGAIHYTLSVHKKSLWNIIFNIDRVAKVILKENIQIVHARSRVPAWIGFFAARKTSTPFVTTCHGYYSKQPFSHVMGWGKFVICPSQVIARHMVDDFAVKHEYIRLIARSVDLEKFRFIKPSEKRHGNLKVGIVGRISPIKGHVYFIKAMSGVVKLFPHIEVLIVGDTAKGKDDYKEELQVLTRRLGLSNYVKFLGKIKNIEEVMNGLDVLVLPTVTHEAFGRVIIEAQAAGVPVVATSVGGIVDIIENNKTGLLVPPKDSDRIAEAVTRILQDSDFSSTLSINARKNVEGKYTLENMCEKTIDLYKEADITTRILVIKLSALGDVILSVPSLRALREKFPVPSRICFLVDRKYAEVLNNCPYIDELLTCDFSGKDKGIKGLWNVSAILRNRRFDLVVDLQNNRKSHMLCYLSLISRRYGYDNGKFSFLLNRKVIPRKQPLPAIEHQFRTLSLLDIQLNNPRLELWPTSKDCEYIESFLANQWLGQSHKLVGLSLSASQKWQTKAWPLDYYAQLLDELAARSMQAVVVGSSVDVALFDLLSKKLKKAKPINACGKTTIGQLCCLMNKMNVFIGLDSAPLHIAASSHIPVVAIFGPTDPVRHFPSIEKFVLFKKDMPCGPCYKRTCKDTYCMKNITPQEVLAGIEELLKE